MKSFREWYWRAIVVKTWRSRPLKPFVWTYELTRRIASRIAEPFHDATIKWKELERQEAKKRLSWYICDEYNRFKCDSACFHARPHKMEKQCAYKGDMDHYRRCKFRRDTLVKCIRTKVMLCPYAHICNNSECRHAGPHARHATCESDERCSTLHKTVNCSGHFDFLSSEEKKREINRMFSTHKRNRKGEH
jgi:hypothetical protein